MLAYSASLLIIAAIAGALSFSEEDDFTFASHTKIENIMDDFRAYPNELMWRQVRDLNDKTIKYSIGAPVFFTSQYCLVLHSHHFQHQHYR